MAEVIMHYHHLVEDVYRHDWVTDVVNDDVFNNDFVNDDVFNDDVVHGGVVNNGVVFNDVEFNDDVSDDSDMSDINWWDWINDFSGNCRTNPLFSWICNTYFMIL